MANILAIDTSTDACSVALYVQGQYTHRHEVIPRGHSGRLMPMLQEILPSGDLRAAGVDAIAYGVGPGSFTGLRIAASAVQGLAFANHIPAIPISTLACQAQTALREGLVNSGDRVLSTLDARINEIYWSVFRFEKDLARLEVGPEVCDPSELVVDPAMRLLQAIGGGLKYEEALPVDIRDRLGLVISDILPNAVDLVLLAIEKLNRGEVQSAKEVSPIYVRDEISWKKIAEQGKPQ